MQDMQEKVEFSTILCICKWNPLLYYKFACLHGRRAEWVKKMSLSHRNDYEETDLPKNSFFILLLILLVIVMVFPLTPSIMCSGSLMEVLLSLLLEAIVYLMSKNRRFLFIATCLVLPTFITLWLPRLYDLEILILLNDLTNVLFIAYVIYELTVLIFLTKKVDHNIIYGSICVYLLLGLQVAFIYRLLEFWSPGSFYCTDLHAYLDITTFIYFSFVTISTMGYGDIIPISHAAQTLTNFEVLIGQFYLTVLVARLVAVHIIQQNK